MMPTEQQAETRRFFEEHARAWQAKAEASSGNEVNVIEERNKYVIGVSAAVGATTVLDVGCGTGELVVELARGGASAVGVDFAQEMIGLAEARARKARASKATFHRASIFEFPLDKGSFDLISANGFIEYISLAELRTFLRLCRRALAPSGSLVLGSRNRLFNILPLNEFTAKEIENGKAVALLREAIALASGSGVADLLKVRPLRFQRDGIVHADTGIAVQTRYQYTPAQLSHLLARAGFSVRDIHPIHIHPVPVSFKERHPEIHVSLSNYLQDVGGRDGFRLVPFASSFMICAEVKAKKS